MSSHRRRSGRTKKKVDIFDPVAEANKPQLGTKTEQRNLRKTISLLYSENSDIEDVTTEDEDKLSTFSSSAATEASVETENSTPSEDSDYSHRSQTTIEKPAATEKSEHSLRPEKSVEIPAFVQDYITAKYETNLSSINSLKDEHVRLLERKKPLPPVRLLEKTKPQDQVEQMSELEQIDSAPETGKAIAQTSRSNMFLDVAVCCSLLSASSFISLYNVVGKKAFSAVIGFFVIGCAGAFGTLKFLGFAYADSSVAFFSELSSKLALPLISYSYITTRVPFWKHRSLENELIILYFFSVLSVTLKLLFTNPSSAALVSFWAEVAALFTIFYAEYTSISNDRPYGCFGVVLFIVGSLIINQTRWEFLMKTRKNNWFYLIVSASVYFLGIGLVDVGAGA